MKRILLIEDDDFTAKVMSKYLDFFKYNITRASSGSKALNEDQTFDVVITDIHLQDINGLIVVQKFRDKFPSLPIIVISGDTTTEVIKSLSHVGATCFLRKPIDLIELTRQLEEVFSEAE